MAPLKKQRTIERVPSIPDDHFPRPQKKSDRQLDIQPVAPPVFALDATDQWLAYLKDHEYTVISAIDKSEIQRLMQIFWRDMEKIHPQARELSNRVWPSYFSVGIIKDPVTGIGQSEFAWECRNQSSVKQAFAKIHGCNSLITSFDSVGVFRNPNKYPKFKAKNGWLHVDQGASATEWCVQGLLNMIEANEETGGFVCLPGSHSDGSLGNLIAAVKPPPSKDFIEGPEGHSLWNKTYSFLKIPAGSLLLWDSKLVHSNTHYIAPPTSQDALSRLVAYVCLVTRDRVKSNEICELRQRCVEEGLTTNHRPDRPELANLPYPRHGSFENLGNCALPSKVIRERYGSLS
ncbi:hypothetical protein ACA910_019352 [Epithemia clementina (nom. ined.)]